MPEDTHPGSSSIALFGNVLSTIDLEVARLAVQGGPLSSFFSSVAYDASANGFVAAPGNDRELIPVFESIFTAAKNAGHDATWIGEWKPLLDIVIGDFSRGESYLLNTYGFLAQEMVAAYEDTGLPLSFSAVASALGIPSDLIVTGSGTLNGSSDADIFYANSSSNDVLRGGVGPDTYIFGEAIGHDVVDDDETATDAQTPDTIRFAKLAASDVSAARDGVDLILTVNATGETVTVTGQFTGHQPGLFGGNLIDDRGVGEIIFADGTVWDQLEIAKQVRDPQPTSDTVTGTAAIDFLDGGAGSDVLIGGEDGDQYFFDVAYGHDRIEDDQRNVLINTPDMVEFGSGITKNNVVFSRDGGSSDLQIGINGTDDTLTVTGQFSATYTGPFGTQWFDRIELFTFSDGSYYTWQDVAEVVLAKEETAGNDTIYGFSLEDTLDGGAGDDFLSGGNENDTYIFGTGYGHDTILEGASNILSGMDDTVEFKSDVRPEDVTFSRDGNSDDLQVTLASGDTLTIEGQFTAYGQVFGVLWFNRIENFKFDFTGDVITAEDIIQNLLTSEKTPGDDTIYGFFREDVLDGGAGNDYLAGGAEGDTYIWGRGYANDVIYDSNAGSPNGADIDKVVFSADVTPDDITISRGTGENGNDLVLTITDTDETLTIQDQFLAWSFGQNNYQIEEFHFADGTVWGPDHFRPIIMAQQKTDGDDHIVGFNTADLLDGGAGNDLLEGGGGGDTYIYGHGYGNDTINAYINIVSWDFPDTVQFTADVAPSDVQLSRANNDLILTLSDSGEQLTILDQFDGLGYWQVENFHFADGTTWTSQDVQQFVFAASQTPGDDIVIGYGSDDTLDGGTGNDLLQGGAGNDTYVFGHGYGRDTIDDNNLSVVGDAPDRVLFKADVVPGDLTFLRIYDDLIIRIDGNDYLTVKNQWNPYLAISSFEFADGTILTKDDVDTIIANNPPDTITQLGTSGDETLVGTTGNDVLDGLGGNDVLQGGQGDDIYFYRAGSGNDRIEESLGTDELRLVGLNPSDVMLTRVGEDVVVKIVASGETVTIENQFHASGNGLELFRFADGTVWDRAAIEDHTQIFGTSGADMITGSDASQIFDGLGGDDTIAGGAGSDTYIFRVGSGNDTINESWWQPGTDTAQLVGLNSTDVTFSRTQTDLFIKINSTGETLDAYYQYHDAGNGIDQVQFADGTLWNSAQIKSAAWYRGTSGADTITGTGDDETFDGGAGNDTLNGSTGSDTYIFGVGSGNDTINESWWYNGTDTARLVGLNPADVIFTHAGYDLLITISSTGETLDAVNEFHDAGAGIEQVQFADGTIWNQAQILAAVEVRGTPGNDTLNGSDRDDIIDGGAGNDTLNGGNGSDIYIYGAGSGNDTINESWWYTGSDSVQLVGLNASDVTFSRTTYDLFITINSTGETLDAVYEYHDAGAGIEQVQFADGSIWNGTQIASAAWYRGTSGADTITGSGADETFDGGAGNDTLNGSTGSDTYIFGVGSGSDTINESWWFTGTDTARLVGLNSSDVTFAHAGYDLLIMINSSGEMLDAANEFHDAGAGIEQVQFADGTVWNYAQISSAATFYRGTTAADTISGDAANNTLDGLGGNDTLSGAAGNDTYIYGVGSGNDTINEYSIDAGTDTAKLVGLNSADVTFTHSGNNLIISINSSGETLTAYNQFGGTGNGLDQVQFANGTIWDRAQIANAAWIRGTSGNDTLTDTSGNDVIYGGLGNDTINSGAGSDTFIYGSGDGSDRINDTSATAGETDTLHLTNLNLSNLSLSRSATDLLITVIATGQVTTVVNQFATGGNGNFAGLERIEFADGSAWTRTDITNNVTTWASPMDGTSGNDTINGTTGADIILGEAGNDTLNGNSGNDLIIGGVGNDTLQGGTGNDTYRFSLGDGQDSILDNGSGSDVDTLLFAPGINASSIVVTQTNTGHDLLLSITGSTDTVTLKTQQDTAWGGVDQVIFADGTTWDRTALFNAGAASMVTAGNDTIYGDYNNNTMSGGAGNDTLFGLAGNDDLTGGTGNDTLQGGTGNDTYHFSLGDGQDSILDNGSSSDLDTLLLGAGISASSVVVTQTNSGHDLLLSITGTSDTITLKTQQDTPWGGVDQVTFANGTTWDRTALFNAGAAPTAGNDTIYGDYNNNTMSGGAGNDSLYGLAGNDDLTGGAGNDFLQGGNGNDTYHFGLGDGQDTIYDFGSSSTSEVDTLALATGIAPGDVTLTRASNGQDVLLTIASSTDSISLTSQINLNYGGVDQISFANGTTWDRTTISQNAWFTGTSGNDTWTGGTGIEAYDGKAGNDIINGGGGNDTLKGGAGNDTLTGGTGNDVFVYNAGFGQDTITDFTAGAGAGDVIEFHDNIFANFAAVTAAASTVGSNTVITVDASNSIVLQNVAVANLNQDDFRFV